SWRASGRLRGNSDAGAANAAYVLSTPLTTNAEFSAGSMRRCRDRGHSGARKLIWQHRPLAALGVDERRGDVVGYDGDGAVLEVGVGEVGVDDALGVVARLVVGDGLVELVRGPGAALAEPAPGGSFACVVAGHQQGNARVEGLPEEGEKSGADGDVLD